MTAVIRGEVFVTLSVLPTLRHCLSLKNSTCPQQKTDCDCLISLLFCCSYGLEKNPPVPMSE